MDPESIQTQVRRVEEALRRTYGFRRGDLARLLSKAGRRLPSARRKDGAQLVEAARLSGHPKMARQVDLAAVRGAARRIESYLAQQDPARERLDLWLRILATVSLILITVFGVSVWFAYRQGLI